MEKEQISGLMDEFFSRIADIMEDWHQKKLHQIRLITKNKRSLDENKARLIKSHKESRGFGR